MRLLFVLLLAGCAADYQWRTVSEPSQIVKWVVVQPANWPHACGPVTPPNLAACATQIDVASTCYVFSYMTEERAKRTMTGDGQTVFDHEMRHCNGERHQ